MVEDSFESRGLIKHYLKQFGIKHIQSEENGTGLLRSGRPIDADVMLVGYGLGYCHNGIELVNALQATEQLSPSCKVIFITNADSHANAYHPCRLLKCDVLRKPINPQILKRKLVEAGDSVRRLGGILESLNNNQLQGLQIRLEQIPSGKLSPDQNDELTATSMQLLLRLGRGNEAWQMANGIQSEEFRAINKLSIANALGDDRKLTLTLNMSQSNPLMTRRCLMYQIHKALGQNQFQEALTLIRTVPAKTYSLAEIELYALLRLETEGLESALDYLRFKYRTSLENTFLHQNLYRIMVKCYLVVCIRDPQVVKELPDMVAGLTDLLDSEVWGQGKVDFQPFANVARLTLQSLQQPMLPSVERDFDAECNRLASHDIESALLLAVVADHLDELDKTRSLLLNADRAMLPLEVTATDIVNRWWFSTALSSIFAEPERAREYNRIGLQHARENNPYPALRMFYRSHVCDTKHASIAINLLDTLNKLGISEYWDVSCASLTDGIKTLSLRQNEADKFKQILASIS